MRGLSSQSGPLPIRTWQSVACKSTGVLQGRQAFKRRLRPYLWGVFGKCLVGFCARHDWRGSLAVLQRRERWRGGKPRWKIAHK